MNPIFTFDLDLGYFASVLATLTLLATLAALGSWRWFRKPQAVFTEFEDPQGLPARVPRAARRLLPMIEAAGFRLMGRRQEAYSAMPYIDTGDRTNVEFEPVSGEADLFLTVPHEGEEEFYFLSTCRDGLALVTAQGATRRRVDEARFDYLRLQDQSVSQLLAEHRARVRCRVGEGHELSGLSGPSGRNSACRIVYETPRFRRRGRAERLFLLSCLAAMWLGLGVLALLGHPPTGLFDLGIFSSTGVLEFDFLRPR